VHGDTPTTPDAGLRWPPCTNRGVGAFSEGGKMSDLYSLLAWCGVLAALVIAAGKILARIRRSDDDDGEEWRRFEVGVCLEVPGKLQRHAILGAVEARRKRCAAV